MILLGVGSMSRGSGDFGHLVSGFERLWPARLGAGVLGRLVPHPGVYSHPTKCNFPL